jgi:hypothetical protein
VRKVQIVRPAPVFGAAIAVLFFALASACAGGKPDAANTSNVPAPTPTTTPADAGSADADAGQPFAGSIAEATTLIGAAVDKRGMEIGSCVREFRERRKLARERVAISFGIDQEGKLLGVTSKGKEDVELKSCVQEALKGAPFPRSHAGVITVTKTYEELVQ